MTQTTRLMDGQVYAVSTVHCARKDAPALRIARSTNDHEISPRGDFYSSILFRDNLPALKCTTRNSKLNLQCLGTDHPTTVLECGSKIINVGLHADGSNTVIHVFVATYVLYSMIITDENLRNPSMKKVDGWISEYTAPSFQIREPLFMQSISSTSIVFSLKDGGMLRLSNNGRGYNEHIFSDSSYFSSFRSILPWSGRPANLIISARASTTKDILFTLSVDAKLKVWEISSGKLYSMHDTCSIEHPLKFLADPYPSNFLALSEHAATSTLVTYCPQRPGLFKIYRSRGPVLEEVFSFAEEQPANGVWRVFDITLSHVKHNGTLQVHVLWKLDTLMMIQTAHVNSSRQSAEWTFAAQEALFPEIPNLATEIIQKYVFEQGLFSPRVLNDAYNSLAEVREHDEGLISPMNLQTMVQSHFSASTTMDTDTETGNPLIEKHAEELRLRYFNLAQICTELQRIACEPHTICHSAYTDEILVAQTDAVSVLRKATPIEQILQKARKSGQLQDSKTNVLRASLLLLDGLSSDSWHIIAQTLEQESISDRTSSADDAMFATYEKTIENQVHASTVAAMDQARRSCPALLAGLKEILPHLKPSLTKPTASAIGIDAYVSAQYSIFGMARAMVVVIMTFLMHTACSTDQYDVYELASLYIRYLDILRRNSSVHQTTIKTIPQDQTNPEVEDGNHVAQLPSSKALNDGAVFRGLTLMCDGELSMREFHNLTLVFLINNCHGALAVSFSQFANHSPGSTYLKARSLLINREYSEAATLFARVAWPLVSSAQTSALGKLKIKLKGSNIVEYNLHVASLYLAASRPQEAVRFCGEALIAARNGDDKSLAEVRQRLFSAALVAQDWPEAYLSLDSELIAVRRDNIRRFVASLCEAGALDFFSSLPFVGVVEDVDAVLEQKARNMLDVRSKPMYHKILYAFRVRHGDFRGAGSIIYHRLQFLRNRSHIKGFNVADHLEITEGYLAIINVLRCMDLDDAWMIVGTIEQGSPAQKRMKKESDAQECTQEVVGKVLKLADVRAEYDKELRNMEAQLNELRELGL